MVRDQNPLLSWTRKDGSTDQLVIGRSAGRTLLGLALLLLMFLLALFGKLDWNSATVILGRVLRF